MNNNGYEIADGVLDLRDAPFRVIENKAFLSAKSVRSVLLPAGLQHIGDWAFAKCTNLRSVEFEDDFRPGIFGREVFKGCDMLREVRFADTDPVTARLLALCANKLPYDHLIRSDDIGQKSWYAKWDICLETKIKSDDAEAKMSAALCGEEDISYDGIGSVDGEMPGETEDYIRNEEFKKCSLCYIRLLSDRHLSGETRTVIEEYIMNNRFGNGSGSSFYSIFEEEDAALSYLRTYLDIVRPDRETIKEMTEAVPQKNVFARSFLIRESAGKEDAFSDLML